MKPFSNVRKYIYFITLFFITLTGFGQMPIFKRYYIADVPGLGWLAQYYVTNRIHYVSAIVLISLAVYIVFDFILNGFGPGKITRSGWLKIGILSGLILSGTLMVVKNLPNVYFGHTLVIAIDLTHIGFCMMLLFVSLYTGVRKKRWVN